MPITSAADLVRALSGLPLLDAARLARVNHSLQGRPDPGARGLARELLQEGVLTAFQVNQMLQGRGADLVLGPYVLLERLGEGGMGQVFKARHPVMDRLVAIKVIRKELLANGDAVERFHREIRLAAQLDHPHLVRAHDAVRSGDTHFLVMEYAEGTDLQRVVRQSGPVPLAQACAWVRQAALGLQYAFEKGLVHRDVKPSNLQVTAHGAVVKVLDMGLARSQAPDGPPGTELTQARTIMGTPDYIAPEQIADPRRVDIRADIYSLGCTLYFLLAGRPPFPDGTWEEKLVCHRKVEPRRIEEVRPGVPAGLGAVVRKMMAKRPEDRYPTPAAAADALSPFCAALAPVAVAVAAAGPAPTTVATPPAPGTVVETPGSLVSPAPGYEPGWTLKANSTVFPAAIPVAGQPAPTEPRLPAEKTVPATAPSSWQRAGWLLAGAAGGLVVALVAVLLLREGKSKEGETTAPAAASAGPGPTEGPKGPPPGTPVTLIKEDFRIPYKNKVLPEGWESDAFRVVKENDDHGIEVTKQTGVQFVKLPPLDLNGNFSIDGEYHMDLWAGASPHTLTVSLENRQKGTPLQVVFHWDGKVVIGDETRLKPPSYNPGKLTHFLVKREGKRLRVLLDGESAADKDLTEVVPFDTLRIGVAAGPGLNGRLLRLYKLTVVALPP